MDSTIARPGRAGRRVAALLLALAAAGGAAACSADSGETASAVAPAPAERGEAGAAAPGTGNQAPRREQGADQGQKQDQGQEQDRQVAAPGVDRKLVRTATLELASSDVAASADRARSEAVAAGGYSGQESVTERSATLTLLVPSDRLDAVLGRLTDGGAGEVRSRSQTAEDVTEQVVDVESRIKTQRASLERVRALLANATSVSDIVSIEGEVTRREADLESLLSRQQTLAGSVALSTITVKLTRTGTPPPAPVQDDGDSFLDALAAGWHGFTSAGAFVLRLVGYVLPFAALAALVAWAVVRLRKRAAAPAPQPAPES
ncbi:DUF4349 domain-containing protein [Actinokineospora bangkokensis]|uniref:DUF4349 domain-containing protein n=1 Tax=Actinokineospora bangkokensis TaxID=1193682 RepID=A0A1Q9LFG9_9PSEU|nr:DUF4349 domain-containing protein [Actinokineospora bangkokensis]OLR90760.1 hypothetical protein BJP25_29675 [Actinokineospora bangkokensis]